VEDKRLRSGAEGLEADLVAGGGRSCGVHVLGNVRISSPRASSAWTRSAPDRCCSDTSPSVQCERPSRGALFVTQGMGRRHRRRPGNSPIVPTISGPVTRNVTR
jgi:hypothetical protein